MEKVLLARFSRACEVCAVRTDFRHDFIPCLLPRTPRTLRRRETLHFEHLQLSQGQSQGLPHQADVKTLMPLVTPSLVGENISEHSGILVFHGGEAGRRTGLILSMTSTSRLWRQYALSPWQARLSQIPVCHLLGASAGPSALCPIPLPPYPVYLCSPECHSRAC